MRIAYFDCFSGASGDMILGALIDSGLPVAALRRELSRLALKGWSLSVRRVMKGVTQCCKVGVNVHVASRPKHRHTDLQDILTLIKKSRLSETIKKNAATIFMNLAVAEGKIHGKNPMKVTFHEVGAVDSIVDIVGACIGIELLEIKEIYCSRLPLTYGATLSEHGVIPIPGPATLELLKGYPVVSLDIAKELVTPTGAAILTTLADSIGFFPDMTLEEIGYGAGDADLAERPNFLRLLIGETVESAASDIVWLLETNLDNVSGEVVGYLFDKLLERGALDVYTTPIQMKKSRPAVKLSVMAPAAEIKALEEIIFRETPTFGIRRYPVERSKLIRQQYIVRTKYGPIRMKIGRFNGRVVKFAPEYEDLRRAAEKSGLPLSDLAELACIQFKKSGEK